MSWKYFVVWLCINSHRQHSFLLFPLYYPKSLEKMHMGRCGTRYIRWPITKSKFLTSSTRMKPFSALRWRQDFPELFLSLTRAPKLIRSSTIRWWLCLAARRRAVCKHKRQLISKLTSPYSVYYSVFKSDVSKKARKWVQQFGIATSEGPNFHALCKSRAKCSVTVRIVWSFLSFGFMLHFA